MRKILIFCLPLIICLQGCSSSDEFWPLKERHITNFPSSSEKYGKAVAEEIRGMVGNLNEMGVDYSRANNTPEFKAEFYKDIYTASPTLIRTKSSVNQIEMAPEVFAERFANLTEIQKKFIGRIIKECEESTSFEDLANRIIDINDDIYSFVPEIQQERLFNITSH